MKCIYGITGSKFHGKDTFANFLVKHNPDFKILHFAGPIRTLCSDIFHIPVEDMENPLAKELDFQSPIYIDDFIKDISSRTGLDIKKHYKMARNIRELLKEVGTGYVRSERDSYWLDLMVDSINSSEHQYIACPDTRFLNEEKVLRSMGAHIIRVLRTDMEPSGDTHISEVEQLSIVADTTVPVRTGHFEDSESVAMTMAFGPK